MEELKTLLESVMNEDLLHIVVRRSKVERSDAENKDQAGTAESRAAVSGGSVGRKKRNFTEITNRRRSYLTCSHG